MNALSGFHRDINYITFKQEGEEEGKKQVFVQFVHRNIHHLVTVMTGYKRLAFRVYAITINI